MTDLFGYVSPSAPVVIDDWPDDFAIQFWDKWPPHFRKYGKPQVLKKLASLRENRDATWAHVFGGLGAYLASNPEIKFIPAPLVWLNQRRWTASYSTVPAPRPTFGDIMRGGVARHG